LKQALAPYLIGGPWGRLLDAEQERLGEASVQAFETEGLIGASSAAAVLAYLFHRIEGRLDGSPTMIIIDEGWLVLDSPAFAAQLREWLKTLRKKNASVIFATQSLADIETSAIAPAIIESCPTRIFLPNERAAEPQIARVYERFGLNDRQIEILSRATPKRDYYCQSRRGNRLFELGLGDVALAFSAASSKTDQCADDEVAIEATGNSAWFRDQILPCVGRVVVVNPSQFKVIRKSVKKTDKNDAAALALFLEKDMLPETRVKTSAENELASLAHTRDLLVKQRTRLLNKIHALHVGKGLKLKKESLGSKRGLAAIDMALFSPCEQVEITVLRETALSLTASLKQLDTEIEKHASALTGYEGIVSIKGVGPRSAAVLLAAIGNVHDFESADKLAAYFGMVPRVAQSNETDHRGRITKRGNKLARTTLVQCSLVATRYSPYLKNFHERIRQRRGTGKAIIATARKLLSIIYDTLKNGWVFSDFTTFSRSEPTLAAGQSS
jgi:transposase